MQLPNVDILDMIRQGFQFLEGVVTDLQLNNLQMIATAIILNCRFNLSMVSRTWLKEKSVNAFSHCLMYAKFNLDEGLRALARMQQSEHELIDGRFIIDDTMEHHSKFCKFIYGVMKHWDHVFNTNLKGICIVFLYYSQGEFIKFPIGWKIYLKEKGKTKNDLALELIEEGLERGFPCGVVLTDSWFCVRPFVLALQKLGLRYILDIKTNATIRVPVKKVFEKRRGRKRTKWYVTEKIVPYMKRVRKKREIGFVGDLESGQKEKNLYTIKERVCIINALPGKHKVVYSYDPKKKTGKYLITNELTWEGLKVVKEYFGLSKSFSEMRSSNWIWRGPVSGANKE